MMDIEGSAAEGSGESGRQFFLIERWSFGFLCRIDQHKGDPVGPAVAIPEAAVVQPYRVLDAVVDQRVDVIRHELLRSPVVLRCELLRLLRRTRYRKTTGDHNTCRCRKTSTQNHIASASKAFERLSVMN